MAKNAVPRIAVVRVSRLVVPRPLMNPPMPCDVPIPSPPPSERWISTTPISARVTKRCRTSRTVVIARGFYRNRRRQGKLGGRASARRGHEAAHGVRDAREPHLFAGSADQPRPDLVLQPADPGRIHL